MDEDQEPQLTVRQLIELLEHCPPDAPVATEGCDCEGSAFGVRPNPHGEIVVVRGSSRFYSGTQSPFLKG